MNPLWKCAALGAAWLAGIVSFAVAAPRYTLVDFGPHTQGVDLNAAGDVVYYRTDPLLAFRYSAGQSTALPRPPEGDFLPVAMNDRGEIVGSLTLQPDKTTGRRVPRLFIFSDDKLRELAVPGLPDGVALGQVVGIDNHGVIAALTNERPARLAFVREGQGATLLAVTMAIGQHEFTVVERSRGNSAGMVVGSVSGSHWKKMPGYTAQELDVMRGFVATERGVTDLGGFLPVGVSAGGRLIGRQLQPGAVAPVERAKAARPAWREGDVVREFEGPRGFETGRFAAISPSGQIVGEGTTVTGGGFLWIGLNSHVFLFVDEAWQDLNDLVAFDGAQKLTISDARRINDRGQILCQAMGAGGFRAVLLTPIAEPAATR